MFSVITASYNKAEHIGKTIESVLSQTFKDWELIIVDDASSDNSVEMIKSFSNDKRIRSYVNEKNLGYPSTLDKLIKLAKGEIIGILDCDDMLEPNALDEVINFYKKNPRAEFVYTQFQYCDENINFIKKGYCNSIPENKSNLHLNCISHFKTFKKDLYLKTSGYDASIINADDKDIIYKFEELTKPLFLDKQLYKFRVLPESMSHGRKKRSGEIHFIKAALLAYKRRLGTTVPNLSKFGMLRRLFNGSLLALREKDFGSLLYFEMNKLLVLFR